MLLAPPDSAPGGGPFIDPIDQGPQSGSRGDAGATLAPLGEDTPYRDHGFIGAKITKPVPPVIVFVAGVSGRWEMN